MKQRSIGTLFICGILAVFLAGCSTTVSPTNAKLVGDRYDNIFFDFQMRVPPGWIIAKQKNSPASATTTRNRSEEEKRAEEMAYEFLISDKPVDSEAQFSHSVSLSTIDCTWDKSTHATENCSDSFVSDFVDRAHFKRIAGPVPTRLGSKLFYRADLELSTANDRLHMAVFVTNKKGHILLMAVSANSEAEIEKVLALIGLTETKIDL